MSNERTYIVATVFLFMIIFSLYNLIEHIKDYKTTESDYSLRWIGNSIISLVGSIIIFFCIIFGVFTPLK